MGQESREFLPAARRGRRASGSTIAFIVVHSMDWEGNRAAAQTGKWFQRAESLGSTHLGVDDVSTHRYLEDQAEARGCRPINPSALHIEQAGFAAWDRDRWLEHEATIVRCAHAVATWCLSYDIPPRWLLPHDLQVGGPRPRRQQGITSHANVAGAWGLSDHWDPGLGYPVDVLMAHVMGFIRRADVGRAGLEPATGGL